MHTTHDNDLHQNHIIIMKITTRKTKTMIVTMNYQVKPASDVTELKLEEVEEVSGQVPAQSS